MTLADWTLAVLMTLDAPARDETERLADAIALAAEGRPVVAGDARRTAALLIAVAYWETGRSFDCARVGDHGHSVSCWQLWVCPGPRCADVAGDVYYAAHVATEMLGGSLRACRRLAAGDRLSLFTTGRCITNRESRLRWATAQRLSSIEAS